MDYILSAAFLLLNLIKYETSFNRYVFLVLSTALYAAMFAAVFAKRKNVLVTCVIMMCYTWQASWMNIFGEPTADMQISWFYITGAIMLLWALVDLKSCFARTYSGGAFAAFVMLIIWMQYPLVISASVLNGVKNYLVISFFVIVFFICFLYHDTASQEDYVHIKKALVWAAFLTALGIIVQYIMYKYAGIKLFKIEIIPSYSQYQTGCMLLMEDHSSSTILLGVSTFYIMTMAEKKNRWYMVPALVTIVASMAMTARRTSTLTLIIMFALFVMFHYKGLGKKIFFGVLIGLLALIMMYFLLSSRPVDTFSQIFSDNGRFENYKDALTIIKNRPLGLGFDENELAANMENSSVTPHNTFLRWACLGGIPFAILMVWVIAYSLLCAHRKSIKAEFWGILLALFAANFVPDLLAARFFVILCSVTMLTSQFREELRP